jgi:hypothetical protein
MKQILLMIAVVALVGGCAATSTQFVPSPPGEISAPNNGMSRIIVYRLSRYVGKGVEFSVILNGQSVGELGPKDFLYWDTEPGFKTLEVRFDSGCTSTSGWKQFSAMSNDLIVLKTSFSGNVFSGFAIPIQILSGAEKEVSCLSITTPTSPRFRLMNCKRRCRSAKSTATPRINPLTPSVSPPAPQQHHLHQSR